LEQVTKERVLYWRLLALGEHQDLHRLLEEALSLIVELTEAKKGYVAIYGGGGAESPRFFIAHSCTPEDLADIRQKISDGVIAEALATGKTINTASAFEDPRFQENVSVQAHSIQEVLCAPLLIDGKAMGVLYLQERVGIEPFSEEDRKKAETFTRHLAPWVDRLFAKERAEEAEDATLAIRKKLKINNLIGKSKSLADAFKQIESAARFDISVILTGPSGTGKTAFARAIHDNSKRSGKPFQELNCAALPENLFESELFGALQGAHSTATKKIMGKLAAAEGGTLFLDEIGELSLSVQGKLLQFLQSKEYFPLGAAKSEKADVRIIAATNVNLQEAIAQKKFREDLYYRLNVMAILVPPLEDRREDIRLLCEYFCKETCTKYGIDAIPIATTALHAVEEADWPGNIRQLANAVESATIRASVENAAALEIRHLFQNQESEANRPLQFQEATRRFQKRFVLEALEATQWNLSETARRLGLARSHVHNLLAAFELKQLDPRKKK
jgi:Nif-specific regulatory protein